LSIKDIEKGQYGELKTRQVLKHYLDEGQYHIINNLIIPDREWTTQIDHIVISKFGIFVIETKYTDSWLYGGQYQEKWTEVYYTKHFSFTNPLYQNYAHTKALAEFLKINENKIIPLIVYWGDCQFETDMPPNVVKGMNIIKFISSKKERVFLKQDVERIYNDLKMVQYKAPVTATLRHNESIKNRYESNTICPKCGGSLVEKTSKKGYYAGKKFLGCNHFPRCHFVKSLN
jgi:hypothetical protein